MYMDGCFDMMHYGHANAMRQAKALGDELVIGLIPDSEILMAKGPPVMNDAERKTMVESVKWVDEVIEGAVPPALTHQWSHFLCVGSLNCFASALQLLNCFIKGAHAKVCPWQPAPALSTGFQTGRRVERHITACCNARDHTLFRGAHAAASKLGGGRRRAVRAGSRVPGGAVQQARH